jgi:hypothetical protein
MSFVADIDIPRGIKGPIKAQFNIVRTVAGLTIPVRCFIATGALGAHQIGSCTYNDLCKDFLQGVFYYNKDNCPDVLVAAGLDCECPFNRATGTININKLAELPFTFPNDGLNQLGYMFNSGDYDVTIKLNDGPDNSLYFGCVKVGYTLKKKYFK